MTDKEEEEKKKEQEDSSHEEIVHCPVYHLNSEKFQNNFGTPFIISVPKNITYRNLYAHIIERLSIVLKEIPDTNIRLEGSELDIDAAGSLDPKYGAIFNIEPINSMGSRNAKYFKNEDKPLNLVERQHIGLEWNISNIRKYYSEEKEKSFIKDESAKTSSKEDTITLYDCLKLFTLEEQLGPDDAWYCNECKEFRQAKKRFDIWSAPKILIVHLKRFSYLNRTSRDKIDSFVDFPLEDLDISPFVIGHSEHPPIYDLYAVSNHYGSMGGGHYTAYAKHRTNQNWYLYDDSHVREVTPATVKSDAAYVLFYKRKDVPWTPFDASYEKPASEESEEDSDSEEENPAGVSNSAGAEEIDAAQVIYLPAAGMDVESAGVQHRHVM